MPKTPEVCFAVTADVLRHGHVYRRKLEALREAGLPVRLYAFVHQEDYRAARTGFDEAAANLWGEVVPVEAGRSLAQVAEAVFLRRMHQRQPTIVHCIKVDPRCLRRVRAEAPRSAVRFAVVLELEGDAASEQHYLYELSQQRRPGMWPDHAFRPVYNRLVMEDIERIQMADLVILMSECHRILWMQRCELPPVIVAPPVTDDAFRFDRESRTELRSRWGVNAELVCVYAGGARYPWQRLREIARFIAAMHQAAPAVQLRVLTPPADVATVTEELRAAGLPEHVESGDPAAVSRALSAADFAVFPRHIHPMNVIVPSAKLGDYLAAGLPVLSTSAHALYWDHISQSTGGFCLPEDLSLTHEQLAAAVQLARLGQDVSWREEQSRRFIEKYVNPAVGMPEYTQAITRLLSGTPWPRLGPSKAAQGVSTGVGTVRGGVKPRVSFVLLDSRGGPLASGNVSAIARDVAGLGEPGELVVVSAEPRDASANSTIERLGVPVRNVPRDRCESFPDLLEWASGDLVVLLRPGERLLGGSARSLLDAVSGWGADVLLCGPVLYRFALPVGDWISTVPACATALYELCHRPFPGTPWVAASRHIWRLAARSLQEVRVSYEWAVLLCAARHGIQPQPWRYPLISRTGEVPDDSHSSPHFYTDGLVIIEYGHREMDTASASEGVWRCPCSAAEALEVWAAFCAGAALSIRDLDETRALTESWPSHPSRYAEKHVEAFLKGVAEALHVPPWARAKMWEQLRGKALPFLAHVTGQTWEAAEVAVLRTLLQWDSHMPVTEGPQDIAQHSLDLAHRYGLRALLSAVLLRTRGRVIAGLHRAMASCVSLCSASRDTTSGPTRRKE